MTPERNRLLLLVLPACKTGPFSPFFRNLAASRLPALSCCFQTVCHMRKHYAVLLPLFVFLASNLWGQCPITVNAGEDIYLCAPPTPTELNGSIDGDYLNFAWTPLTGLSFANTLSPGVNVTQTTTYVLTGTAVDVNTNLIDNGDFEGGNSGFTSDYVYNPGDLVPEGYYDVLDNPQDDHPGFQPCDDHTSGSGNMMAVNGAGTPNQNVWCETVPVIPNTQYAFSAWVSTLVSASPALLQFSINGVTIGPIFSAPTQTCVWQNFYQIWNSGGASSATICIVNQNTTLGGNDFALDDIVFSPTCKVTDTVVVHVVNVTAVAAPLVTIIPCEGANVNLSGVGSSTGANYSYLWDSSDGNIVSGETTLNPVVNGPGTYTLTVTFEKDGYICEKTATVNVIITPNPLSAWINPPQPLGCGTSGTTNLVGNSNQGAVSWQWSTQDGNIVSGANSKTAVVNAPGTYELLVTNTYELLVTNTINGCTAVTEVTVTTANNPPVANAAAGGLTCVDTVTNLLGTGSSTGANITYAWSTVGGMIVSGQNMINAVAGAPGTYFLLVTNTSNNCATADTVVVTGNLTPPVPAIQTPGTLSCANDTFALSGSLNPANASFVWTTSGGGNIVSGGTTLTPQINTPGTYTLSATNPANGCKANVSVTVSQNITPPTAFIQPADSITCQSPSVTLSGAGSSTGANFTYQWTASGTGNIVSGDTTLTPLVNAAGTYSLLVTNALNGCTASTNTTVVADQNVVSAVANAPDTLTCAADTLAINANGSSSSPTITYAWTTANGNIVSGAATPNPLISQPGTYQLVVTNTANGCSATDLAQVVQNVAAPQVQITAPGELTCANPTQTIQTQNLSLPGNFAYQWAASAGGNILSGDSTLNPVVNAAGTYTITTTNLNNGCTAQNSTSVTLEVGTPTAVIAPPPTLNCIQTAFPLNTGGSSTGAIFTYQWLASGGGNIFSGNGTPAPVVDAPGQYALTVTNTQNGCTATTTVTVNENIVPPPADAGSPGLLTCNDPVFNLVANNGQPGPNLDFAWSTPDGNFTGNADSIEVECDAAGVYAVLVTDLNNGCTSSDVVSVSANQQIPTVWLSAISFLNCLQLTSEIQAIVVGPNFNYNWQTLDGHFVSGQTTSTPLVDAPGLYGVTVTDLANGCTATQETPVSQDITPPTVAISPPPVLNCATPQFLLGGSGTGTPSWTTVNGQIVSGGDQFGNALVNAPGTYVLTAVNPFNGCTAQTSVTVSQNITPPVVDAGADDTLSCAVNALIINGSASGQGTLTFVWTASGGGNITAGGNTATPTIDASGTYSLVVTDPANGCSSTDAVQIFEDANAPQAFAGPPVTLNCNITQTTLSGSGSSGPNISYLWTASAGGNILSGPTTLAPIVDAPGTYQLQVTNSNNGCVSTSTVIIPEDVTPPIVDAGAGATLTCAIQTQTLTGTASASNGSSFNFQWQTADGSIVSGGNSANPVVNAPGTYTLTVQNLVNGCFAQDATVVGIDAIGPTIFIAAPQTLTCLLTSIPLNGSVQQPSTGFTSSWTTSNGHFVSGQNTLTPIVDAPGTYLLTVQNQQNGCSSTVSIMAQQNIVPPVADAAPADLITCNDPQISLDATGSSGPGPLSFAWSASGGGVLLGGANSATPSVNAAGVYTVTVTNTANGCTDFTSVNVAIDTVSPATAIISPLPLTCVRDTVTLNAGASANGPNFSANWSTPNGHLVSGQNTLFPKADQPGNYVLVITNLSTGCTGTANINLNQNIAPPQAEAGPPAALDCLLPQATLQGSSTTQGNLSYNWSTTNGQLVSGANTATPLAGKAGLYALTVTNQDNGCTATDNVSVSEIPPPVFEPTADQPDCLHPKGEIDFGPVSGGTPPFTYSRDGGQTFQASPVFPNLTPDDYSLVARDAHGCTAVATVTLDEPVFPELTLPQIVTLDLGDSTQLMPELNLPLSQIAEWQWSPGDYLSCIDCPDPIVLPLRSTRYKLTITDLNGCTASAPVQLRVNRQRSIYAPNIFTPNGDGFNDTFKIFGKGVTDIPSFAIFDRWGNQVFFLEHLDPVSQVGGWDGQFRGSELNPGVFVWQAVVEFLDGETEVFAGDVTLER